MSNKIFLTIFPVAGILAFQHPEDWGLTQCEGLPLTCMLVATVVFEDCKATTVKHTATTAGGCVIRLLAQAQ